MDKEMSMELLEKYKLRDVVPIPITCLQCKKQFFATKNAIIYSNVKFCSRKCSILSRTLSKEVNCYICGTKFIKSKFNLEKTKHNFCSHNCFGKFRRTSKEVICTNCAVVFIKNPARITKNNFCSKKCTNLYLQKHKKYFVRSKLEIYLEQQIRQLYPQLKLHCNDRNILGGLELDFYFPDLRFAIELNGPTHYEPIYGEKQFDLVKNNDKRKMISCYEMGIELMVINIYEFKNLTSKKKIKILDLINSTLSKILSRATN